MSSLKDISQRFIQVYEYLKKTKKVSNQSTFSADIGISNSMLTEIFKYRTNVGMKVIQNTVNKFPFIDSEWLLTGKGSLTQYKNPDLIKVSEPDEEYGIKTRQIPLIPIDAMAGWGTGSVQIMDFEVQGYVVPDFEDLKVDFMIRVRGNSMYPKFSSGNIVACIKIETMSFFQWNKIYVLDTSQGAVIKRVKQSQKTGHILCVSDNKDYDPFDISMEEINAIALIVGVIGLE